MALVARNPLFDVDSLFDNFFAPAVMTADKGTFTPRVDIKDKEDCYEITAEMPGAKKEDLNVSLDNGVMTIEAETRQEHKEEKDGKVIQQESRCQSNIQGGVLTLEAPKVEPTLPEKRRIEIA